MGFFSGHKSHYYKKNPEIERINEIKGLHYTTGSYNGNDISENFGSLHLCDSSVTFCYYIYSEYISFCHFLNVL